MGFDNILSSQWFNTTPSTISDVFKRLFKFTKTPNTVHAEELLKLNPELINYICSKSCYRKQYEPEDLDWRTVFDFLEHKMSSMNPLFVTLLISVILLLLHKYAFTVVNVSIDTFRDTNSTQSCTSSSNEIIEPKQLQYPAEQRALLQFQRNKSDPMIFRYSYDIGDTINETELTEDSDSELIGISLNDSGSLSPLPSPSPPSRIFSRDHSNHNYDRCQHAVKSNKQMKNAPRKLSQGTILKEQLPKVETPTLKEDMNHSKQTEPFAFTLSPAKSSTQTTKLSITQVNGEPFQF